MYQIHTSYMFRKPTCHIDRLLNPQHIAHVGGHNPRLADPRVSEEVCQCDTLNLIAPRTHALEAKGVHHMHALLLEEKIFSLGHQR